MLVSATLALVAALAGAAGGTAAAGGPCGRRRWLAGRGYRSYPWQKRPTAGPIGMLSSAIMIGRQGPRSSAALSSRKAIDRVRRPRIDVRVDEVRAEVRQLMRGVLE